MTKLQPTIDPVIYREGRQFGLETRATITKDETDLYRVDAPFFLFPVLRCQLWALRHGLGWLPVSS
jgi:hypothetical protein